MEMLNEKSSTAIVLEKRIGKGGRSSSMKLPYNSLHPVIYCHKYLTLAMPVLYPLPSDLFSPYSVFDALSRL